MDAQCMTAAVLYEANKPLVIETVDLDEPQDGEVLVRIAAAGVCASDYHVMKGEWTMPLQNLRHCFAVDQLHRQEPTPFEFTGVVCGHDIGML